MQQAQETFEDNNKILAITKPPIKLKNFFGHLGTINHHRRLVRQGCFKMGLYKQGLTHDLSKYSPVEFLTGCRFYQGTRSPNAKEREYFGYSRAWLHHKGRNKHHFEYWVDFSEHDNINPSGISTVDMPNRYIAEMIADRIAASKTYRGSEYLDSDPIKYYEAHNTKLPISPSTRKKLIFLLKMLASDGENKTFSYIKNVFLQNGK